MEKHLKNIDFLFDKRQLTIYQTIEDDTGGYRTSMTIPYRNLYSLLVFILRIFRKRK